MPAMSKPLIVRVGEAMWGSHWPSDMATCLGVGPRTTRRYVTGEREPGQENLRELRRIVVRRIGQLHDLAKELPE
jgi:hypothetical protein